MSEELWRLIAERNDARTVFIKSRFQRDAAATYYDSVVTEGPKVTQPAWEAFSAKQMEMDVAGDHFNMACGNVIDHVLPSVSLTNDRRVTARPQRSEHASQVRSL
jgi:hypothetical protein